MGCSAVDLVPRLAAALVALTVVAAVAGRLSGLVLGPAAATALVPPLDQTRTVGPVTLPGAFVGVLLGGGTPLEAGATQLLVPVGLLAAQVTTVWTVLELVARGRLVPGVPR